MSFKPPSDKHRVVEPEIVPYNDKVYHSSGPSSTLLSRRIRLSYNESRNINRFAVLYEPMVAFWEIAPFLKMAAHMQ